MDRPLSDRNHREDVRESARAARERARTLAARLLVLRSTATTKTLTAAVLVAEAKVLRDSLRATVSSHAQLMRELEEPPERVVTIVKELAADAARDAMTKASADWMKVRALREDLVRWTIDAYYGAPF